MNSPRYAPAGLLIDYGSSRVMIDGGPGATTNGDLSAWLVTDDRSELIGKIRKLAQVKGLEPEVTTYRWDGFLVQPRAVIHTSHSAYGYLVRVAGARVVWAPEFLVFPRWAKEADLMFAEAAGWNRPILFRGRVGGHASVRQVARDAQEYRIKSLVFAHIGRPTIKALESGERPAFGEFGHDGEVYSLRKDGSFSRQRSHQLSKAAIYRMQKKP
jgi:hypothetical protein